MPNKTETNSPSIDLAVMQMRRLLNFLNIPLVEPIHVKKTKVDLIRHFGFCTYKGLNENYPVEIPSDADVIQVAEKSSEILKIIDRELSKGHFLHIRIVDGQQRGSGNPVVILGRNSGRKSGIGYERSAENTLDDKLILSEGELIGFKTNEEEILIEPNLSIDIFSQPVSVLIKTTNLDNEKERSKKIRLGGGFRLEFEKIENENPPHFVFKAVIAFDDNSPRVTALNFKKDWDVPRKEIDISLEFDAEKNKFIFPKDSFSNSREQTLATINNEEKIVNVRDVGMMVLENLVKKDGQAMAEWLKAVLYVNPKEGVPSIEGVFSVKKNGGDLTLIGPKIISWDGLETAKEWLNLDDGVSQKKHLESTFLEFRYQMFLFMSLSKAGLINPTFIFKQNATFSEEQFQFHHSQDSVVSTVNVMLEEAPIESEIKKIIADHIIPGYNQTFRRERTGPRLLGELLKTLSLRSLEEEQNSWKSIYKNEKNGTECSIWQYKAEGNKLTLVSIEGFVLGFWFKDGLLVEINNMFELKEKSQDLSGLLNLIVVPAMLNNLREGD